MLEKQANVDLSLKEHWNQDLKQLFNKKELLGDKKNAKKSEAPRLNIHQIYIKF